MDGNKSHPPTTHQQKQSFRGEQNGSEDDLGSIQSSFYQTPNSILETGETMNLTSKQMLNKTVPEFNRKPRFSFETNLNLFKLDNESTIPSDLGELPVNQFDYNSYSNMDSITTNDCSVIYSPLIRRERNPLETESSLQKHQLSNERRHSINIILNPVCQVSYSTQNRSNCPLKLKNLQSSKNKKPTLINKFLARNDLEQCINFTKSTGDLIQFYNSTTGTSISGISSLSYLKQRKKEESCDSIKTTTSNASILSNDDLGPLAFQATKRSQGRRTSNFLEIPGDKY